jgi:hypothetical protein
MKALLLLPLSLFSLTATGSTFDLPETEINPPSEEVLIKKPEKYLRNESMIYDLNSNLGIKDQRRYTGTDNQRLSFAGHVAADYEHFNQLLGVEAAYMMRSSRYNRFWWGAQFFQHRAHFDNITQNRTGGGVGSEAEFQRPGGVKDSMMGFGPGIGYRFKLLLDFWPSEDWFETVDVFVNAIQLNESFIKEKYNGYGLSTNYGLHKRSSTSYFYGGKLSYNVANVTRKAIAEESKSERSLSLGWLSLAFEFGVFF